MAATLQHGAGIGAEYAKQRGAALQRLERAGDVRLLGMTVDVDEEDVVPFAPVRRTRLDARHAYAVLRQRLEQPVERAGRIGVGYGDEQRRPVLTAGREQLAAEHEEARGVVGTVLDLRGKDLEPVDLRRGLSRDRGRAA